MQKKYHGLREEQRDEDDFRKTFQVRTKFRQLSFSKLGLSQAKAATD
jgi:hypothetical protein